MKSKTTLLFLTWFVFGLAVSLEAKDKPVQVYLLAGQSNMDGYGGLDALDYQARKSERKADFKQLLNGDGWAARDDVFITFRDRMGPLTAGYGVGKTFMGVEWEFGNKVGDLHEAKVLIIKTSWGGAAIRRKFRPPSSGEPKDLVDEEFQNKIKQYEKAKGQGKEVKKPAREDIAGIYGSNYRKMLDTVRSTLADIKSVIPDYDGEGYELAGFVWFQGFNDQFGGAHAEYDTHLANLIRDVRKEFKKPDLPVVIGQMGHGGTVAERQKRKLKPIGENTQAIKDFQAKVAAMEEFKAHVTTVATDTFWDWKAQEVFDKGWKEHLEEWKQIGAHFPFHYLGSPYFFMKSGQAFGDAMVALKRK